MKETRGIMFVFFFLLLLTFANTLYFISLNNGSKENQIIINKDISRHLSLKSSNHWPLWTYRAENHITSVAISADGKHVAAGSSDNKIYFFNTVNSTPLWSKELLASINSVDISANGEYIIAGDSLGGVWLYNENGSQLWNHTTGDYIKMVSISADGQYIAVGSWDLQIYLFNRTNSTPKWTYNIQNEVESIAISANGQYVVAGSAYNFDPNKKKVYFFNRTISTPQWNYTTGSYTCIVSISADGQYVAVGAGSNELYLFSGDNSTPLWISNTGYNINHVSISADGQYISAGTNDNLAKNNRVFLFNRSQSTYLWSYKIGDHENKINTMAISANGQYIAIGASDTYGKNTKVYLFHKDIATPLWTHYLGDYDYKISKVDISADGQYIVAGGSGFRIDLFHITLQGPIPKDAPIPMLLSSGAELSLIIIILIIVITLSITSLISYKVYRKYISREDYQEEYPDNLSYFEEPPLIPSVTPTQTLICPVCECLNSVTAVICSNCSTKFEKCIICDNSIGKDEAVFCPFCNIQAHKLEFLEWLKIKASCPNCKKELDLWEFQRSLENHDEDYLTRFKICDNCKKTIPIDADFCIYCGFKIK